MLRIVRLVAVVGALLWNPTTGSAAAQTQAPLFESLGKFHHAVTTDRPLAQRYFDQGLILVWAFNHAEAARSFRAAARLDPRCAMCYWGLALALGPNINSPMSSEAIPEAWNAVQRAQALATGVTDRERIYIWALSKRYAPDEKTDRYQLDLEYVKAMRYVLHAFPKDVDAGALYVEAVMTLNPRNYWTASGAPQPWTPYILRILDWVVTQAPEHPGANHLYVHALESSPIPEQALASAERLTDLAPDAGHFAQMGAHIYFRVGRYLDAAAATQKAIAADRNYLSGNHVQGFYTQVLIPRAHYFLSLSAAMSGRSRLSIEAAKAAASAVDPALLRQPGMGALQHYYVTPLYALARFGRWREILATPQPVPITLYTSAVWHYVRGLAFVAQHNFDAARRELNEVRAVGAHTALSDVTVDGINPLSNLVRIAVHVLAGEMAVRQDDFVQALLQFSKAVELQDELRSQVPPAWYYPVRQSLGAVLLKAGFSSQAESVYRRDLEDYPDNGWDLHGLARSLLAQGKAEAAQETVRRFRKAWRMADINLDASGF